MIRFSTSSPYLVEDVKTLCRYFGVNVPVSTSEPRGWSHTAYTACPSVPDMYKLGTEMRFVTDKANEFWSKFIGRPEPRNHSDIVPISYDEATFLMAFHATGSRLYTNAACARSSGRTTRKTALEFLDGPPFGSCPLLKAVAEATDVGWRSKKPTENDTENPVGNN